jgi:hypothetical protein
MTFSRLALLLALSACSASTQTVVVHSPPSITVDARPEVHVAQTVHAAGGGGAPRRDVCPGVSVQDAGETRSGRALGMALLQVAARPWVDLVVDGVAQGRTPLIAVGVEAGPRELRLVGGARGYDCTMRLHAIGGRRYAISVDTEVTPPWM